MRLVSAPLVALTAIAVAAGRKPTVRLPAARKRLNFPPLDLSCRLRLSMARSQTGVLCGQPHLAACARANLIGTWRCLAVPQKWAKLLRPFFNAHNSIHESYNQQQQHHHFSLDHFQVESRLEEKSIFYVPPNRIIRAAAGTTTV